MQGEEPPSYESHFDEGSAVLLEKLRLVASKYELAGGAIAELRRLEGYKIVVIADDSGSMHTPVSPGRTRWHELCERVIPIVEIACCLASGIDLYFLNRPPAFGIADAKQVRNLFKKAPGGGTPMTQTYKRVLKDKLAKGEDKVLVVVATDGVPNSLEQFKAALVLRGGFEPYRCPTSIMACTDSEAEVGWLNHLDDTVPYLDVVDDFASERQQVLQTQGRDFPFSMGDYLVKTLCGPISNVYDSVDERRLTRPELSRYLGVPESELPRTSACDNCVIL
jgi:hypothetical protein